LRKKIEELPKLFQEIQKSLAALGNENHFNNNKTEKIVVD